MQLNIFYIPFNNTKLHTHFVKNNCEKPTTSRPEFVFQILQPQLNIAETDLHMAYLVNIPIIAN